MSHRQLKDQLHSGICPVFEDICFAIFISYSNVFLLICSGCLIEAHWQLSENDNEPLILRVGGIGSDSKRLFALLLVQLNLMTWRIEADLYTLPEAYSIFVKFNVK